MAVRLQRTVGHLTSLAAPHHQLTQGEEDKSSLDVASHDRVSRFTSLVRWNGWGFRDTSITLDPQTGLACVTGNRYLFSGMVLPHFRSWAEDYIGLDINKTSLPQDRTSISLPPPVLNHKFLNSVKGAYRFLTFNEEERLLHSHGHTCQDIWSLRYTAFDRYVDVVVYPGCHDDVERIVKAAVEHDAVIIPYGGGTTVAAALECPQEEKRMIVSLDMHEMSQIQWINRQNMTASIEAGAVGREIEEKLERQGLTLGHEPDSSEFSTLGGWISTRASGMMKNKYGNIEDIVVQMTIVTPQGTFRRPTLGPRVSMGPDVNQFVLGSEGTFGVVTEAVVKVHVTPEKTKYGSLIFPSFDLGVRCMHEIARRKCAPVSIRLVDNEQFQFGQALKSSPTSRTQVVTDKIKKWYVTKALQFDPHKMVVATLKFIGSAKEVARRESEVLAVAKQYSGKSAGEENGRRGYFLTFMIAYIRDFGFNYNFMAESFETSVPWSHCLTLCRNVKDSIRKSCEQRGVRGKPFISCRVTQTYHAGACVYFYFGFMFTGLEDPIGTFSAIEHEARASVLLNHGSLSHHHGIGKHRKDFMEECVTPTGIQMLKAVKDTLDPSNVFANGNLI